MKLEKIEPIINLPELEEEYEECKKEFKQWFKKMMDKEWFREYILDQLYFDEDIRTHFGKEIEDLTDEAYHEGVQEGKEIERHGYDPY